MECYFYTTGRPALFQAELHCNKDKASGVPPLLIYLVSLGATKSIIYIYQAALKQRFFLSNTNLQMLQDLLSNLLKRLIMKVVGILVDFHLREKKL